MFKYRLSRLLELETHIRADGYGWIPNEMYMTTTEGCFVSGLLTRISSLRYQSIVNRKILVAFIILLKFPELRTICLFRVPF